MGVVELKTAGAETGTLLSFDEWDALVAQGRNVLLLGLHKSGKTILADATGQIAAESGRVVRLYRRNEERREIPRGVQLIRSIRREMLLPASQTPLLIVDDLDDSLAGRISDLLGRARTQLIATMYCPAVKDFRIDRGWLSGQPAVSPLLDKIDVVCTIDWRRRRIERVCPL